MSSLRLCAPSWLATWMNESAVTLTYALFDKSLPFLASSTFTQSPLPSLFFLFLSEAPAEEQPTQKEEPLGDDEDEEEDEEEYHYVYEDEEADKEDEYEKKESRKMPESQDEDKTLQEVKGL